MLNICQVVKLTVDTNKTWRASSLIRRHFILSIFLHFDKFHSSLSFTEAMIQTYPNQVHHFIIKKATFLNENFWTPTFHCFALLFSGFVLNFKLKSLHFIWYPITWCLSLGSVESDFKLNLKYPDCTTVLLMYHCKDQ